MNYPRPALPPSLSFQGTATFLLDGHTDLGASDVALRCDATGRVLCWCLNPSFPLAVTVAADSNIVLSCSGTLNDGRSFSCSNLCPIGWPSDGLPSSALALRAQQFVIEQDRAAPEWLFALTNLLLPNFSAPGACSLSFGDVASTLTPETNYTERMKHLRAYKGTDVTALLGLSTTNSGKDLCALANDLCLILSVLTGQKVNWVSRQTDSALVYENRVTKPCSGWPVLGRMEMVLGREWNWEDLLGHALKAVPQFEQRAASYPLRDGLIDSWIDARIATDFLETRCLKTVAVLEVIKTAYRAHRQGSFSELLAAVHQHLALPVSADVLAEIVDLRNSIVHEGTFLLPPSTRKTKWEQYEMLIHFSDRLMLTLVGHSI